MDAVKIYDIDYPSATAGTVIADNPMTIAELVAEVDGNLDTARIVSCPAQVGYDYVPIDRN